MIKEKATEIKQKQLFAVSYGGGLLATTALLTVILFLSGCIQDIGDGNQDINGSNQVLLDNSDQELLGNFDGLIDSNDVFENNSDSDSFETEYVGKIVPECELENVDKNLCYLNFAVKTNDVTYCYNAISHRDIPECITQYAMQTNNPQACTTKYKFTNRMRFFEITNDYRYQCYFDYAFSKNDVSTCNLIDENQNEEAKLLKGYCIAVFSEDLNACSGLEVSHYLKSKHELIQGDCLIEIAKRTKNASICEYALNKENGPYGQYVDERMNGVFFSDCYNKVAPAVGDRNLCEKSTTYPYKYIPCVGAFIQPDEVTEFCNTYKPDYVMNYNMKVQCVKDLVTGKQLSFCESITDDTYKQQCIDALN